MGFCLRFTGFHPRWCTVKWRYDKPIANLLKIGFSPKSQSMDVCWNSHEDVDISISVFLSRLLLARLTLDIFSSLLVRVKSGWTTWNGVQPLCSYTTFIEKKPACQSPDSVGVCLLLARSDGTWGHITRMIMVDHLSMGPILQDLHLGSDICAIM